MTESSRLTDLLAAAEPSQPKPLEGLISRLEHAGLLQGTREGGRAIGGAALAELEITSVSEDSRRVLPGSLFVAVPGDRVDGHDYLAEAAAAGARAALVERPVDEKGLPQVIVARGRSALAEAACCWYADRAAKLSLFERLATRGPGKPWPRVGIVNRDDAASALFEEVTREAGARLITYGTDPTADVRATRVGEGPDGLTMEIAIGGWSASLAIHMSGRFNAHNALAVVALGEALALDHEAVLQGLRDFSGVPGRMERVDAGQPFGVIIDFAHAPTALATVLDDLAPLAAARGGELIAVLGAPGERDAGKRPVMGRVAAERCRLVVLT